MYNEIKLLNKIYRRYGYDEVACSAISKDLGIKYGTLSSELNRFVKEGYLVTRNIDSSYIDSKGIHRTTIEPAYRMTSHGSQLLLNNRNRWIQFYIPVLISIAALVISILSYIQSLK